MVESKRCPSCGVTKSAAEFGSNQSLGDELSFYCQACNRAKSNAHYRKRRAAAGKKVRDLSWVPNGFRWCPTCNRAVAVEDYVRNSAVPSGFGAKCKSCHNAESKEAYWLRQYGMSREGVDEIRAKQSNRCALCAEPDPGHLDQYVEVHRARHAKATAIAMGSSAAPEAADRPGSPPVGSDRRPGGRGTTSRSDGRSSRSRRQTRAGEADH